MFIYMYCLVGIGINSKVKGRYKNSFFEAMC